MIGTAVWILGGLTLVAVASVHHFGWEGAAIPAAIWLLMPQLKVPS